MIHATAIVDPAARIGANVSIGAYSVIGAGVDIGEGTTVGPHVVIEGTTRIGRDNRIFQFASVGAIPQDKKYGGEDSELVIGDRNVIREFVTLNRGTGVGGGATRIGNDNWIMAYAHVAHDCTVGNHTIFSNNATLAGHVTIGDYAILSGFAGVHQFCRIGAHAMLAAGAIVLQDVPPYVMAQGYPAKPAGTNNEGLRRRGFSAADIARVRRAYRTLYRAGLSLDDARAALSRDAAQAPVLEPLVAFLGVSGRGLVR